MDEFKESAGMCFSRTFNYMMSNAILNEKEFDVVELLNDARKITATVMNHYMPVSEINELKNLNVPLYLSTFTEKTALVPVKLYESGITVKDTNAPGGYRTVMPLPGMIEKAREEIKTVLSEWNKEPEKIFKEDAELVSSNEREQIVVDLNAERELPVEPIKEVNEKVIENEPLVN